ncbi:PAS domain-containing hybrid sensor histidine kinase/response regulator [Actinoplanes regularis]|uniref:PAS domain-containing hybrid sensor histidine kinase/response regulator n=1 Tax=Actinoplanes regularis TaxID=52697 RepID=UPI0024A0E8B1|nr:PAS domain S-box protein [Actinoplanes regularis]GLW34109.1 hypothetical protein Areg01_70460 [Actinoplanes regularis]
MARSGARRHSIGPALAVSVLAVVGLLLAAGQDTGWYRYALLGAVNAGLVVALGLITGARMARIMSADPATSPESQQPQLGDARDSTDRPTQAQLNAQLAGVVAAATEAIVSKSLDGTILTWNPGAERLYGYTAAEMLGRDLTLLMPAGCGGEEQDLLGRVRRGEVIRPHETRRVRKDGTVIDVSLSMAPVRNESGEIIGASAVSHDVTADVEAARRLRIEREQLRLIMAEAGDPFLSIDENGRITEWNRQAHQLLGWARHEVVGRPLSETVLPARYASALKRLLDGDPDQLLDRPATMFARHSAGQEIPVEITVWRTRLDGPPSFHALARDITARRRIEQALELDRDRAVVTAQLKSRYLAMVSHEVRTPMSGVIGLSDLLLATPLDDVQRKYATGIHDAGMNLLIVVTEVLDFAKLEAGKVVAKPVDFEPGRLLDEVADLVRGAAGEAGPTVRTWCDPRVATPASGDAGKLRQILLNLAGNAVKFTPAGEVVLTAAPEDAPGATGVRFTVTDTGIGIDEKRQTQLFEPFTQGDATAAEGTGLGLTISRELVAVLGGELRFESRLGQGSTFWFTVPLGPARGTAPRPAAQPEAPAVAGDGEGRVLVVEDNEINQIVATGILSGLGYRAEIATNGLQAVKLAAANDYQAILMDCLMPEMDGYQATAAIRRAEPGGRHVPIIAMTAGAMAEDRDRCLAAGMDDHLAKPVMAADLAAALTGWATAGHPPADDPDLRAEIEARLGQLRSTGPDLGPRILAGLLRRLSDGAPALLDEILDALAHDDLDAVQHSAHQLKGVAANLGVTTLAETCERVEDAARSGDLDQTVAAVTELRTPLRATLVAVETIAAELASRAPVG